MVVVAVVVVVVFAVFAVKIERSTHEAGLRRRDIFCFHELVFFPFSSDGYRGQKEQTKNNDYIHNGA